MLLSNVTLFLLFVLKRAIPNQKIGAGSPRHGIVKVVMSNGDCDRKHGDRDRKHASGKERWQK